MGKKLDRLAAKQQAFQAPAPVRSHDDKVAPELTGLVDDFLVGIITDHDQAGALAAARFRAGSSLGAACGSCLHRSVRA